MGKRLFKKVRYLLSCFIDIIFPPAHTCVLCGRKLENKSKYILCTACLTQFESLKLNDFMNFYMPNKEVYKYCDSVSYVFEYRGIVCDMVRNLKYGDKKEYASAMALMIEDEIKSTHRRYDIIVNVPSYNKKKKKRGYNQSQLLAVELSNITNIPYKNLLIKIKDTKSQVLCDGYIRWYNVKDAFECRENLKGKSILIVDDVITTGATVYYCAKALKEAGAGYVGAASFAKTNIDKKAY